MDWYSKNKNSRLSYIFGLKFFAMYFVAVVSGMVAQLAVDSMPLRSIRAGASHGSMYVGGYTLPYDMSAGLLCVGFGLIAVLWKENYGHFLA